MYEPPPPAGLQRGGPPMPLWNRALVLTTLAMALPALGVPAGGQEAAPVRVRGSGPGNASETALAKLAAGMKPGAWAELKTEGYSAELLKVQHHHILEYTDAAVWDPTSQQVLFVGQGHYSAVKFVAYAA